MHGCRGSGRGRGRRRGAGLSTGGERAAADGRKPTPQRDTVKRRHAERPFWNHIIDAVMVTVPVMPIAVVDIGVQCCVVASPGSAAKARISVRITIASPSGQGARKITSGRGM